MSLQTNYWNAIPNVFWSVLCIAPLFTFCYKYMEPPWLYGFTAASLFVYPLPASFLRVLELSSTPAGYRRLGVHLVSRLTQDSRFIKRLSATRPNQKRLPDQDALSRLRRITWERERFHWTMLVFFFLSALYAVSTGHGIWAIPITAANVIYNLYPIWLQQFIRLRLQRLNRI